MSDVIDAALAHLIESHGNRNELRGEILPTTIHQFNTNVIGSHHGTDIESKWRVYLKSSNLADWIITHESGVSKNYAQELARRTLDAMIELSNHRLVKTQKQRTADGLRYKENVVVLKKDVDLPGEPCLGDPNTPATDEVAG